MTGRTFEYMSKHRFPHNRAQQFTSFVGREREKKTRQRLLATVRRFTPTGEGEVGKTPLASEVAAQSPDKPARNTAG